jgi:pSer/pThr/pTyr-binding forkhead associated (FHA) protein
MGITVAITVLTGPHKNRRFWFEGPVRCTVGRGADCLVRFSGNESDLAISRHHCRLDIDPPCIQLRDLGSLNGTYLNGKKLSPANADGSDFDSIAVGDSVASVNGGDIITLGETSFRIGLVDCPRDSETERGGDSHEHTVATQDCAVSC